MNEENSKLELLHEIIKIKQTNAALLEALNKIVNHWDDLHPKDRQQAREAIRKAQRR